MNIKKAIEKADQIRKLYKPECDWVFMSIIDILEALDEPIQTSEYVHTDICECSMCHNNRMSNRFYNENKQLKADLAIANGLVKNLEEKIKKLESMLRVEGMRNELKDGEIIHLKQKLDFKEWIKPSVHFDCKFCNGTGIEKPLSEIRIYGKTMKQIADLCDFAEQHGYKEK